MRTVRSILESAPVLIAAGAFQTIAKSNPRRSYLAFCLVPAGGQVFVTTIGNNTTALSWQPFTNTTNPLTRIEFFGTDNPLCTTQWYGTSGGMPATPFMAVFEIIEDVFPDDVPPTTIIPANQQPIGRQIQNLKINKPYLASQRLKDTLRRFRNAHQGNHPGNEIGGIERYRVLEHTPQ